MAALVAEREDHLGTPIEQFDHDLKPFDHHAVSLNLRLKHLLRPVTTVKKKKKHSGQAPEAALVAEREDDLVWD